MSIVDALQEAVQSLALSLGLGSPLPRHATRPLHLLLVLCDGVQVHLLVLDLRSVRRVPRRKRQQKAVLARRHVHRVRHVHRRLREDYEYGFSATRDLARDDATPVLMCRDPRAQGPDAGAQVAHRQGDLVPTQGV